jgi:peptidoglycan DL-endopeptidase CwlO
VASHRRPKSPSRTRVTVLTAAAATAVAITANAQSAQAAPQQTTASLKAEVQADNTVADTAVQKYDASQEQQQQLQRQTTVLQNEIARQQAAINAQESVIGATAAAQYRQGTIDPSVQLMLSANPSDYLQQASTNAQLDSNQASMLSSLRGAQTTLDHEKAEAEAKLKSLDTVTAQLASAKAQVQQKLAAAQARLNSFTAAQRAAVERALDDAPSASTHSGGGHGDGGTGGGSGNAGGGGGGGGVSVNVNLGNSSAGDSIEAAAFAAAQTRLGDVYIYGDDGPTTFDCSGLMMWAYAKAGLNIGRTTYDQIDQGTPVSSESDLRVGDLIFFNDDSHVGMYAGNGMVLHAPHPGAVVRYESLDTIGSVYAMRHL